MKELLQKGISNKELNPDIDLNATSILLFAFGDGLIIRIADDPGFDFSSQFRTFEAAVRNILTK